MPSRCDGEPEPEQHREREIAGGRNDDGGFRVGQAGAVQRFYEFDVGGLDRVERKLFGEVIGIRGDVGAIRIFELEALVRADGLNCGESFAVDELRVGSCSPSCRCSRLNPSYTWAELSAKADRPAKSAT